MVLRVGPSSSQERNSWNRTSDANRLLCLILRWAQSWHWNNHLFSANETASERFVPQGSFIAFPPIRNPFRNVDKAVFRAVLFTAFARLVGLPARVIFVVVKQHVLKQKVNAKIFFPAQLLTASRFVASTCCLFYSENIRANTPQFKKDIALLGSSTS